MICTAKQPTSAPMLSLPHILWIKSSSCYYTFWYRFKGRRNTKFTRISAIKHFLDDLCWDMSVIKVYNRKTILSIYLSFYLPSAPMTIHTIKNHSFPFRFPHPLQLIIIRFIAIFFLCFFQPFLTTRQSFHSRIKNWFEEIFVRRHQGIFNTIHISIVLRNSFCWLISCFAFPNKVYIHNLRLNKYWITFESEMTVTNWLAFSEEHLRSHTIDWIVFLCWSEFGNEISRCVMNGNSILWNEMSTREDILMLLMLKELGVVTYFFTLEDTDKQRGHRRECHVLLLSQLCCRWWLADWHQSEYWVTAQAQRHE